VEWAEVKALLPCTVVQATTVVVDHMEVTGMGRLLLLSTSVEDMGVDRRRDVTGEGVVVRAAAVVGVLEAEAQNDATRLDHDTITRESKKIKKIVFNSSLALIQQTNSSAIY